MSLQHLEIIKRLSGLKNEEIVNVYPYGSRVYQTNLPDSDYDYIVITVREDLTGQQFDSYDGTISCHVYSVNHWQIMLDQQKIFAIECQCSPIEPLIKNKEFDYVLNKPWLRAEISAKASNSFVKCKKKLEVEQDYYIGVKSLFHSLRIPALGIQIARDGKIMDYTVANEIWKDIYNDYTSGKRDWNFYKEKYKPLQNELLTEFRKYAEKTL